MNELTRKLTNRQRRSSRVRSTVSGTTERPRLALRVTNLHVNAQIIDDTKHQTLVAVTTVGSKMTGTMTEKAVKVASELAKAAKAKKISKVVFDRGNKLYHGRVKAFADAARQEGLEF